MLLSWRYGSAGRNQVLFFTQIVGASIAESFFGSLKIERVFDSVYKTRVEARQDIFDYIEMFYNSKRRHSYLGYPSLKEFEKKWL